jgi:hypothetical protein
VLAAFPSRLAAFLAFSTVCFFGMRSASASFYFLHGAANPVGQSSQGDIDGLCSLICRAFNFVVINYAGFLSRRCKKLSAQGTYQTRIEENGLCDWASRTRAMLSVSF